MISNILNYLLERIRILSLDLQFGRRKTDIYSIDQNRIIEKWTQGRVYINRDYGVNGLAGLIELSQFSYLPLRMILKYSIGTVNIEQKYLRIDNKRTCYL